MNKKWLSLSIYADSSFQSVISSYFDYYSIGGQFNEKNVTMYFLTKHKVKVNGILNSIIEKYNVSFQWGDVKLENWMDNWKDSFKPIKIDDRVMIIPDWDKNIYESDYVIKICPAMAFGTGHHESTQLVINQMLKLEIGNYSSLLDLGTGSGILSILAKKMGIDKVTAIDIDDVCEDNFYQNCKLSDIDNIDIQIQDVHAHEDYNYDIILANIDKSNIIKILDKYQKTQTKAIMIMAGILISDLDEIIDCASNCSVDNIDKMGEWASVMIKNKVSHRD